MDSEADSEAHFRMDHISNSDFFFDSCENDNFNDFVHNTSDSNDTEGVAHLLGTNTHAGTMNMNMSNMNLSGMNLGLNMDMDMGMGLGGMNAMSMDHMEGQMGHASHSDKVNNTDSLTKGQIPANGISNKAGSISRPTSENSDVGGAASIDIINEGDSTNNTSPLEKTTTATSSSSAKQKLSPKRALDKRRGSLSTDEAGNQQKRTRASGEILEYLMNEFAKNSNPTTAMRKEISNKTGMPERSVRIWFQNRRAKARKMEKLNQKDGNPPSATGDGDSNNTDNMSFLDENHYKPSSQPQPLSQPLNRTHSHSPNSAHHDMKGALSQMNTLPIEINGKYYVIECKSLSVGNWQRIRSGYVKEDSLKSLTNLSPRLLSEIMATTDLLVILSKKDKELNYFFSGVFQNEKVLFRIFYPLVNILKCSILNQTQQMNNNENYNPDYNETLLQIELGATPQFAVHFLRDPATGKENVNQWSICEDFSEGQQVATAFIGEGGTGLPHILSDDLNRLKYFNTLISSINKTSISKAPVTTKTSAFPGPAPESQIMNPGHFSPLNHSSTNNSTPSSINMMPSYAGFPQNSYSVGLNDDGEILGSDLIYSLGNGSNLSAGSLHPSQQYQPQSQLQMQQIQKQYQQHVQQQQKQPKQHHQHQQQFQQHQQPQQHQHQQQPQLHQQQHIQQQHQQQHTPQQSHLQQQPLPNHQQPQPQPQPQPQSQPHIQHHQHMQENNQLQNSPHELGNQRTMFMSQMQQKKLQQSGGRPPYNGSNSVLSSTIGMEGIFNSAGVDSDTGEGKMESSDLDIFRQDHINDSEEVIIKADDENMTTSDPILLAAGGRDELLDTSGADNDYAKQENDNFFLDDGINGLGF